MHDLNPEKTIQIEIAKITKQIYNRNFTSRSATLSNFNRALELVESNTETAGPGSHTARAV